MTRDQYYTPDWLADRLAALLPKEANRIVDLAVGHGSLLEAVHRNDATKVLAGVDIERRSVALLKGSHASWTVSQADSLNPSSYRSTLAFRQFEGAYDAAILNPPFSYRGGTRIPVRYRDKEFRATPATAFLAHAHSWLSPRGVIVALVPENAMNVRGDAELWRAWKSDFSVETVQVLDRYTFPGARTTTVIVRLALNESPLVDLGLRREVRHAESKKERLGRDACSCVHVVRGRVPVHRVPGVLASAGAPYVHSTHLRSDAPLASGIRVRGDLASRGPLVLVPRVGTPSLGQLAVVTSGSLVLSDCVFGLRPGAPDSAERLVASISANFADFSNQYVGSCARYLTVSRLLEWLRGNGWSARQARADEITECACVAADLSRQQEPAS